MTFPITTLTAGLMGLLFFLLSWRVIRARQTLSKSANAAQTIERRIRGHANFSEYVPICLIMLGLAEVGGAPVTALWFAAGTLVIARLLHGYAFALTDHSVLGRVGGTALTLVALIVLAGMNLMIVTGSM